MHSETVKTQDHAAKKTAKAAVNRALAATKQLCAEVYFYNPRTCSVSASRTPAPCSAPALYFLQYPLTAVLRSTHVRFALL